MPDETLPIIPDVPNESVVPSGDSLNRELGNSSLPFLVVGIGASAGGLEAFMDLLQTTPSDTGMAFVIISHLSASKKSFLADILSRSTTMPVVAIEEGMRPQPNRVFIIPPNTRLVQKAGVFHLSPRPDRDLSPRPIDIYFRSLAEDQKNRAIGIVLSGTDSDGALGLRAIKGDGGISIVQDERTAKFDDMPRHAIAADHVDLILSPSRIGTELGQIAQRFRAVDQPSGEQADEQRRAFRRILSALRKVTGVDFSVYKETTLRRRIARRMVVTKIDNLSDFASLLESNEEEARELYEDALISVTQFFRDPAVFEVLKTTVFAAMLRDRDPALPIRIWIPGCATGEEVYSIAICLLESMGSRAVQTSIQIFGTDVSRRSINFCRRGIYPESTSSEVSQERLRKFFVKLESGYQISKRIREFCVFAEHNLTQDPPYSRLDMVSCRNVLIYLGAPAQKAIIAGFHYALRTQGVLLLGQSEAMREFDDLFSLIDKRAKLFRSNPGFSRIRPRPGLRFLPEAGKPRKTEPSGEHGSTAEIDLQGAVDRIVVMRHGPPGVVVNDTLDIVQTLGNTSPYLMLPRGEANLNVLRMAKHGLAPVLAEALKRVLAQSAPVVVRGVSIEDERSSSLCTLEISPIVHKSSMRKYILILFLAEQGGSGQAPPRTGEALEPSTSEAGEKMQVYRDLASTQADLNTLMLDWEGASQDLISANEEIQSSNEELQSINEELETAKEELQSQTEELQTVNEELHQRNDDLTRTTSDLVNLLNNLTMPVVILNAELQIRQFTPLAEKTLSIRSADLGRHIREIRLNLRVENIEPWLQDVIDNLVTKEMEIEDLNGCWHVLRARPYRTIDNHIEGVVLVMFDIDHIRQTKQALKEANEFSGAVIESVKIPLAILDNNLRFHIANRAFQHLCSLEWKDIEQRSLPDIAGELWALDIQPVIAKLWDQELNEGGVSFEHEFDKGRRTLTIQAQVIRRGGRAGVLLAIEEVTSRKQAERLLWSENQLLEGRVQMTEIALRRSNSELQRLAARLFTAQEEERRRVARDLHDDLSQKIALLQMHVEELEKSVDGDQELRQGFAEVRRRTGELAEDLKRVAHQLHPQILDDLGLAAALERLAREFEVSEDMPVQFSARGLPAAISQAISSSLYRLTQESLHNISKHAGNTPVTIKLSGSNDELHLEICDEGVGFDVAAARLNGGMGLVSMQERVRLLGGKLLITSKPGEGARIEATIPLPKGVA